MACRERRWAAMRAAMVSPPTVGEEEDDPEAITEEERIGGEATAEEEDTAEAEGPDEGAPSDDKWSLLSLSLVGVDTGNSGPPCEWPPPPESWSMSIITIN